MSVPHARAIRIHALAVHAAAAPAAADGGGSTLRHAQHPHRHTYKCTRSIHVPAATSFLMAELALPGSRAGAALAPQLRLGMLASHIACTTDLAAAVTASREHICTGRDRPSCGSAYCNTVATTARGTIALPQSDTYCTDDEAEAIMKPLIEDMQAYYASRGIFQGRFGFGKRPAVIVIDFAYKCVK